MNIQLIKNVVLDFVKKYPFSYFSILKKNKTYKNIFNWIEDYFKNSKIANHKISEKCYWLVHGFKDFKKCPVCGKDITAFISINLGYHEFCSLACIHKSDNVNKKFKTTCQRKFNANSPLQSDQILNKIQQTNIRTYGIENPMKTE